MATLQEDLCRGRHQGNAHEESQGFRGVIPEEEGAVRIATGTGIVAMVDCDEDMSLGLGFAGEELMEKTKIFKVVNDQQQGDLRLEQVNLDLAGDAMGGFVIVWQEHKGMHHSRRPCPDVR